MLSGRLAQLLLRKAAQDAFVVAKLIDDPESPDEAIGFHSQQAVEKLLKAVLASRGVRYRRTHDLVELIDLLREHSISFPAELEEIRRLTPFATEFRYDEFLDESQGQFDRAAVQLYIAKTRAWAQSMLGD
jgi:HEPN domain-containing protein